MISTLKQMPRLWLEVLAIAGLVVMVLVMLTQGRATESVLPILGFFAVAAFRLMPSANRILGAVQAVRYDLPVINVIFRDMQLPIPNKEIEKLPSIAFNNTIELHRVSFSYKGSIEPVIKDIELKIERGESVGIIGPSGSGKSTLVDIILGLLKPSSGEVRVDSYDINTYLRSWQNNIGYVPQSIYLTDDTLRRNVAFGLANEIIDEVAVIRAIRSAQLEEFVSELPDGLDTQVGEHGVRLSGGQRQRIGIARALYHDPAVLVLDEATSSLDIETEAGVMEAIQALHGDKTIIIVAHRLSTVEDCDRIYELEKGSVINEGTPEEILWDVDFES
jgi:ABC-type multidrug transport system fused ATPase/permease subunit